MYVPADRSPAAIAAALAEVERACVARGQRFTKMRRLVLEVLWRSEQPVRAYDLRGRLEQQLQRRLVPPTVYRALNFLMEQKFAARLESRSAFVPCAHPEQHHAGMFFICEHCGTSAEIDDSKVEVLFAHQAATLGFHIARRVVELQGTCATCASNAKEAGTAG
ncbi:Fur family transcriptional regulator [Xanthobacter sp. 126]|jgi:Fur family transcriptional regulator, zinc uptake regulator|uniref:Fur family transcriptional regulator n=1 Tax=Xanthobacter sp. 126 TaxID=1131814 RepID=UPI00045EAA4C|nr:Fur family transcriptional regulator [Xanthobacter sp. 126]